MTKKDFCSIVAKNAGFTIKDTAKFIKSFTESVHELMECKDKINIPDLGIFEVVVSKSKRARNPKTGEIMVIPDRDVVKFRVNKKLKFMHVEN